ncbi:MAG: hydroxyacylglutathione hydrolase family protein [Acetobacter sp.]|nr:hydroxyacylglutathione hydrolase family protein [Acetobacter sp.]
MTPKIIPVFCNEKNMANYAYIITDEKSQLTIIIDAAETQPILNKLNELNLSPSYILTTHHHFDHVEANEALKQKYDLKIIAPEKEFDKVPAADIAAIDNSIIKIGTFEITPLAAPGHTNGHLIYHFAKEKLLFTGDVLFNCCIGGLFEGTPAQMFDSLQKIKALPDNTLIFPGHEYTRSCLPPQAISSTAFQSYIEKMLLRETGHIAPATLAEEKQFNPYLQAQTLAEFIGQ